MNRRSFVKRLAAFSLFSALPLGLPLRALAAEARRAGKAVSRRFNLAAAAPIQDISGLATLDSIDFNGDEPDGAHDVLWNVPGFLKERGGVPPVEEEVDVLILGAGLGGLTAAYELRAQKPVVLDQARQFGGNAKGERYGSTTFPLGSVYVSDPEPGTAKHRLLDELGLLPLGRAEDGGADGTVFYQNRFHHGFWNAVTDPGARAEFERVFRELKSWTEEPAKVELLSFRNSPLSAEARRLDSITFEQWLKETFGTVHPRVLEYFQLYGWSSFLGSMDELSALQALDFITAETGKIMSFPGGLAAISQGIFGKLRAELPEGHLRPRCLAVDVRPANGRTEVCYVNFETNTLHTIRAKTCIFAGPKFIANRVVRGAPAGQVEAWKQISYRAYVVANVIFKQPLSCPSFELYCLDGTVPERPTFVHPSERPFSDTCFASWPNERTARNGAITIYRGLAYDGAHQYLFSPSAHRNHKEKILNGLDPLLRALGRTRADIQGVRLTRWGHPMPLAYKGLLGKGVPQAASRPVADTLFFVNQDNWANPCFETAYGEARRAAKRIREILGTRA